MDCKLSLLIPWHEAKHKSKFHILMKSLDYQLAPVKDTVEILDLPNKGQKSIGHYRQTLLENAKSEYVVFIDADDRVSIEYIALVMNAINTGCDVVGLSGTMTTNGTKQETWEISKDLPYDQIEVRKRVYHYRRYSNHLAPIKREIALQIGYKDMKHGEDYDYAKRLHESGLCKTETKIENRIYHYDFWNVRK